MHPSICHPAQRDNTPPIRSAPAALPLHHPSCHFRWLFVDWWFFWPNGSHLRPTPPPISLFVDVSYLVAPNKGTSHPERKPSAGCLQRTHRERRRDDLGAPLLYPWRERAKLLEGWVAPAHVGCCVLCCVVLCVVILASLATILVVTRYQQSQNGRFLHAHVTKLAPKHPKYNWMCKLVII